MARKRQLLTLGPVSAMLFTAVFLVNGIVKPDYDPVRDYVCEGSIGRGGWLQIAGLMVVFLVLAVSSDPEHGTAGLYQRFQLTAGWSWVAVLGLRARHTLTSATPASAGRSAQQ